MSLGVGANLCESNMKIRIGTRTSNLALAQVQEVIARLKSSGCNSEFEIVPINTSGDKIQNQNLAELGGKGLFIKELEESLISKKIDFAVHSAKDVPPIIHQKTTIAAFTKRFDDRDCFISPQFNKINDLPQKAVVGTSSARRKAFLLKIRPDLQVVDLRGNVDTRLGKVFMGSVDAAILAMSGIIRLEKQSLIQKPVEISEILPAGGQGSLAIQAREGDLAVLDLVSKINDELTRICIKTERAFLRELGASCFTPVGVNARFEEKKLVLRTAIISHDGSEIFETKSLCDANLESGITLGIEAANETKNSASKLFHKITAK